jgi:iron complex outermembrane recepter protein
MMPTRTQLSQSLSVVRRFVALLLASTLAGMAFGADVGPPAALAANSVPALEEVIVTGSRIAQPQLEAISPVTVVSAETIQSRGVTNIEDLLNQLPQVMPDQSSNLSQGSSGVANLNLRDLGSNRTLVLINGRRLMPGDPTTTGNGAADVNNIPVELVQRVELLTGSASATYGADAVAGVVNFIMDDHFQGVKLSADYGTYYHDNTQSGYFNSLLAGSGFAPTAASGAHTDGGKKGFSLVYGSDFANNEGNFTAYFTYHTQNAVPGNARDYNACTVGAIDGGFACRGSGNTYPTAITGNDGNSFQLAQDGSAFVPLYQLFNYGPDHYFQRSDQRYNAGFFEHVAINEHVEQYAEFMFMRDETQAKYAPSGIFFSSGQALDPTLGVPDGNYYVNCGTGFGSPGANPFLNATLYGQLCNPASNLVSSQQVINGNALSQIAMAQRNAQGGDRSDSYEHTSFRAVAGARGSINDAIKFDTSFVFGITSYQTEHLGDLNAANIANALLAVRNPVTGQTTCLETNAPGCVPFNPWSTTANNAAALQYMSTPFGQSGETRESVLNANMTFDLGKYGVKLPWTKDGLLMNIGAESRKEQLILNVDPAYTAGLVAGSGIIEPVNGGYNVWELFSEGHLALIQDAPLVKDLSTDFGFRYSDYSEGFKTNTYKLGLTWAPSSDVRIRGSFQRAVRAPNVNELFLPDHVQLDGGNDFCANGNVPMYSAAQCANTGVSAAQYGNIAANPASQYNGLTGGTSTLTPEVAITRAIGLVITPSVLPAFSATIDYFDINVNNLIGLLGADFILGQCALNATPRFCALVNRAPNGSLWLSPAGYVRDVQVNSGDEDTAGVDLALHYRFDLGRFGALRTDLAGTFVQKFDFTPFGSSSYNCAGLFGPVCGPPLPKWRSNLVLDWGTPIHDLDFSLTWRFVNSVKVEYTSSQLADTGVDPTYGDIRLPSFSYFDLSAAYRWNDVTFRLGVNNLFDKSPPLIGASEIGNGIFGENNTYPQVYDSLGRFIHMSITAKF